MPTTLDEALDAYQLELSPQQTETFDTYCQLLWEWNEKLNLTRHTNYELFVTRDVIDSIRLAEHLVAGESVMDVGSGGGVPGILLAVLRPDVNVSLCESVGKKARALADITSKLNLNTPVIAARAQDVLEDMRFDTLVARAVGPMWKMLKWFQPHWSSIGRMLIIKGPKWLEERGEARHRGLMKNLDLRKVASYSMPNRDGDSVILNIEHKKS